MRDFLALIAAAAMVGLAFFAMFWPRAIGPETDPRCDGPARYEAMREASEAGRKQPC